MMLEPPRPTRARPIPDMGATAVSPARFTVSPAHRFRAAPERYARADSACKSHADLARPAMT
jgi:hypothetical protein